MSDLKVADTTVPGVLDSLKKGEWLVPEFQRDFVWSTEQISALVQSVLEARPIGMVTLWEQADDAQLRLERLSIPDDNRDSTTPGLRYFGDPQLVASKRFALLDGKQRCTALAMAFGGFRASHGLYRHAGRYFLNVTQDDPRRRVEFYREADVRRQGLHVDSTCVARGLFPLASNIADETILAQWMRYLQALGRSDNYPDGRLPEPSDLARRNRVLQESFEGIVNTKLAVYIVPEKYTLADICEIFETLNTTGTKVSTVDLIHSWLYSDTFTDTRPINLREWIGDIGERDGAIGWSDRADRPELIAQIVTACYVALETKPTPRPVGRATSTTIDSVKASDLLATPKDHWKTTIQQDHLLAEYVGDGQKVTAGGFFPWTIAPYPVSLGIYVALRWHAKFDEPNTHDWGRDELDALFRAFFWRNALSTRYDQGFLSAVGSDIVHLKKWLRLRTSCGSSAEWVERVNPLLTEYFGLSRVPTRDELRNIVRDRVPGGAMGKAIVLPMRAGAKSDPVNTQISLAFPNNNQVEMHHIYPREWCRNNQHGALEAILNAARAGFDYVNSAANLMPLSRESNNAWKQKYPAQFIREKQLTYEPLANVLAPLFIDRSCFELLAAGETRLQEFWDRRADLIVEDLLRRTEIRL